MRLLRFMTIGMGVLIVAGVVLLAVLLTRRVSPLGAGFTATLAEPPGTRIAGVAAGGDALAVQLQGGGVDRVVLIDARNGRITGRLSLAP